MFIILNKDKTADKSILETAQFLVSQCTEYTHTKKKNRLPLSGPMSGNQNGRPATALSLTLNPLIVFPQTPLVRAPRLLHCYLQPMMVEHSKTKSTGGLKYTERLPSILSDIMSHQRDVKAKEFELSML